MHQRYGNEMPIEIAVGAVICQDSELIGDIRIGARTVVRPKCSIVAEGE